MLQFNKRVEICGGIASGKTTLACLLKKRGLNSIEEDFSANPFIQQFYKSSEKCAFETELTFVLQHFNDIKTRQSDMVNNICDFSILLDLSFADVTLSESEQKVFISVYNEIVSKIGQPDLLIYLKCDPSILLKRIISRSRDMEQTISIDYLQKVIDSIEKRIQEFGHQNILVIDSERYDFTGKDDEYIVNLIKAKIQCS